MNQALLFMNDDAKRTEYLRWRRKNVTLRGVRDRTQENGYWGSWGKGLYQTPLGNREMARGYGKVFFLVGARPTNPKVVLSVNGAELFRQELIEQYCKSRGSDYSLSLFEEGTSMHEELIKQGYDGFEIRGREIVNYKPSSDILWFASERDLYKYYANSVIYNLDDSLGKDISDEYEIHKDPDDSNRWHISRGPDKNYTLEKSGDSVFSCSCPSFKFRKTCKHVDLLKKELVASGELRIKRRFTRSEIDELVAQLDEKVLQGIIYEVAGSYRRGRKDSKDLDIVVLGFDKDLIQARLAEHFPGGDKPRPGDRVAPAGGQSGQYILRWYVPLGESEILMDFQFCAPEHYEATLLFYTGSGQFNMEMRARAKAMGYALNQYGLWDREDRTKLVASSERDIFKALNMPYQKPTQRG